MADDKPEKKPEQSLADMLAQLLKKRPSEELGATVPGTQTPWLEALGVLTKLSEQQKAAAQKKAAETNTVDNATANAWFNEHWKLPRNYSVCRSTDWAMTPQFAHVSLSLLGRHAPVRTFPCVVLTCRTCGQTLFFNAVLMGLLPEGAE